MVIHFADEDLLLKLIAWNLFNDALLILGTTEANVRIISGFAEKVWNRDDWRKQYGDTVLQRVHQIVSRLTIVDAAGDVMELSLLTTVPKIDPGEAILFTATATVPAFRIVTGDKNCLIALNGATSCAVISQRVRGNVVHLEQIILRLIDEHGVDYVRKKVKDAPKCDLLMQKAFGSDFNNNTDTVRKVLLDSIRKLHADCGGLLQLSDTEQPTGF